MVFIVIGAWPIMALTKLWNITRYSIGILLLHPHHRERFSLGDHPPYQALRVYFFMLI